MVKREEFGKVEEFWNSTSTDVERGRTHVNFSIFEPVEIQGETLAFSDFIRGQSTVVIGRLKRRHYCFENLEEMRWTWN